MDLEAVAAFLRDRALAIVHDHDVADGVERLEQWPQQAGQRLVDEDDLVFGVVHDVRELVGEEADVERVEHTPGAGRREVELEVPGGVPRERRNSTVRRDAEGIEHPGDAMRALGPLAVRDALDATPRGRHHGLVGEELLGALKEVRDRERMVLHQALHECPRFW